ncbi:low-complexity tail membrane protein [Vulcanococcus sp.]|uniref:low-complexity tail membrane protein n=1 Tax=Vulcanococcus sp. TaxID=2856995 RepID=UPI003C080ABE
MNPARREPLLWLQLLGLAALPLEALLLFLVFAGADPGPFPGFERLLTWALGALAPAVLFWRLPPDLWSLLLVQVPLRGRRPEQLRLSALQQALLLKLLMAAGAALLLPLSWWCDAQAGLAWSWSPFSSSPRLVVLLVCVPVLALMQWQWAQVVQAIWMLTRSENEVEQTLPLDQTEASEQRLNLGLPVLLLAPLAIEERVSRPAAPDPKVESSDTAEPVQADSAADPEPLSPEPEASPQPPSESSAEPPEPPEPIESTLDVRAEVAVLPEEQAEEAESTELNQEIAGGDNIPAG